MLCKRDVDGCVYNTPCQQLRLRAPNVAISRLVIVVETSGKCLAAGSRLSWQVSSEVASRQGDMVQGVSMIPWHTFVHS